jgi:AcrR family transcriptional regulator
MNLEPIEIGPRPLIVDDRRPTKSERTRRRVLDAAAACFKAEGYAGVSLRDIAAKADMQAGSLYYHFESKEALVEELLHVGVDNAHAASQAAVTALGAGAESLTKLRAAITAHLCSVLSDSDYSSANLRIFGQVPETIRERVLARHRSYGNFWAELLRDGVATGTLRSDLDISVVRMLLLGALNWTVEWYRPGGRSPNEIADHLCAMLFDGLKRAEVRGVTGGS